MPKASAAKRAKKAPKITAKQIAALRGESTEVEPRKAGPSDVMAVYLDGPLRCLTPIPRSDLCPGQAEFTHPYRFDTVRYVLARREGDLHYYEEATQHEPRT